MSAPFQEVVGDDAILNFIFDPHKSFIGASAPHRASSAASSSAPPPPPDPREAEEAAAELRAVRAAEAGDLVLARTELDALLSANPGRASAFNNRWVLGFPPRLPIPYPVLRAFPSDIHLTSPAPPPPFFRRAQVRRLQGDLEGAKADLDACIDLAVSQVRAGEEREGREGVARREGGVEGDAAAAPALPSSISSALRGVLKQAYAQRAIYFHSAGDEARASADLDSAAACGNVLARMMTTGTNPYATLCHQPGQVLWDGLVGAGMGPGGYGGEGAGGGAGAGGP
jgi:hypothetical protein